MPGCFTRNLPKFHQPRSEFTSLDPTWQDPRSSKVGTRHARSSFGSSGHCHTTKAPPRVDYGVDNTVVFIFTLDRHL